MWHCYSLRHFNFPEEKPVRLGDELAPSILSVLWALSAGRRLERSDTRLRRLLELMNCRARAFDMAGGSLNQFPFLRFVAPEKTGYNLLTRLNQELREFLMVHVADKFLNNSVLSTLSY